MYASYVNLYFIYSSDDIENQCKYSKNEFKTVIFILTLLKIIILKSNILRFYACGHTDAYHRISMLALDHVEEFEIEIIFK